MSGYIPPYTISNKMFELVSEISEKVGRITSHKELESKPHLRRNNRIRSIHSSLKIEANSLSLSDVRDVINGHLVLGDQKEIQEVKNAYVAYEKIPEIDPTSISDLKRIHGILTYRTARESGVFRKGDEGVLSGSECIFVAPPPHMVNELMRDLMQWVKENEGVIHPLILSAIFHYEFVFIHPFADGNGRMARLWHTVLLYRWRSVFEYIPLESQIERFQNEYYDAIAVCHTKDNSDIFIEFMLDMINQILDEVVLQVNRSNSEVSEYVKRMLAVMEYEVPYTSNSIMEALGLKSKETLRKNYINPAMELGLIKMTLPDKPNSRNQRYVKQ
ncbi:Fic family protein [Coprococcus sp. AF16-5]|jgi:Fic family protein|uniref:Fic family protein n=1 Tax=Coprococcus sp. AF16-5 TaxID=2293088 RepID=UPI000E50FD10|nr:Fic family protein [Coprococcus sp. AF16-5]NSJ89490.1 Fic family protein [Coprococcus sp. MSK.21.13]RHR65118.1 Fic family protein [Coprococcus sp. AF16-5]